MSGIVLVYMVFYYKKKQQHLPYFDPYMLGTELLKLPNLIFLHTKEIHINIPMKEMGPKGSLTSPGHLAVRKRGRIQILFIVFDSISHVLNPVQSF